MLQQRAAKERERGRERQGKGRREGRGGAGGRGGNAQWEGWKRVGERERARKKTGAAGGRTPKLVPLDTSHSLRG